MKANDKKTQTTKLFKKLFGSKINFFPHFLPQTKAFYEHTSNDA